MVIEEDLRTALSAFDGKATAPLVDAEAIFQGRAGYVDALIGLIGDHRPFVGSGATWLLKRFLERGGALSDDQTAALMAALPQRLEQPGDGGQGAHWSTALHLLQSARYLSLTMAQAGAFKAWLTPLLVHKRPFVRAFALDALASIARLHGALSCDFEAALALALDDPAASVRARARALASSDPI